MIAVKKLKSTYKAICTILSGLWFGLSSILDQAMTTSYPNSGGQFLDMMTLGHETVALKSVVLEIGDFFSLVCRHPQQWTPFQVLGNQSQRLFCVGRLEI